MTERAVAPKREIFGWAMFDFANQAYTLLIITVVFGDLFTRVIVGDGPDYRLGNLLWSLALATSYLLVVVCSPVAGAVMDYTARRKQFLFGSYLLTVVATAALYFVAPGYAMLGVLLIIISNFAYSIGEAFIASFLPDLGPPDKLGAISGIGWALGYVGGMVSAVFVLLVLGEVSAENFDRIRWVGPWAAGFFLVAAIPTFLFLRERGRPRPLPAGQGYFRLGLARVGATLGNLRGYRDLAVFLLSTFLAMSGMYIIIAFSFIYGAQVIGWDQGVRTLMFIIVQISAAVGAVGFGLLQTRLGGLRTYRVTVTLWVLAVVCIYATPQVAAAARALFGVEWQAQYVFLVVGTLAGSALGACQSTTRALVGAFAPQGHAAEFFGFWGLSLKLAGAFSLLLMGLLQAWVGLHLAILFCALLFIGAFLVSWPVDEQRGRRAAEAGGG